MSCKLGELWFWVGAMTYKISYLKICLNCGRGFLRRGQSVSRFAKRLFCSRKCCDLVESTLSKLTRTEEWNKKIGEAQTGNKNHMWKGDNAGVSAFHIRLRKLLPIPDKCPKCNLEADILEIYVIMNGYVLSVIDQHIILVKIVLRMVSIRQKKQEGR